MASSKSYPRIYVMTTVSSDFGEIRFTTHLNHCSIRLNQWCVCIVWNGQQLDTLLNTHNAEVKTTMGITLKDHWHTDCWKMHNFLVGFTPEPTLHICNDHGKWRYHYPSKHCSHHSYENFKNFSQTLSCEDDMPSVIPNLKIVVVSLCMSDICVCVKQKKCSYLK